MYSEVRTVREVRPLLKQYNTVQYSEVLCRRSYHHVREGSQGNVLLCVGQPLIDLIAEHNELQTILS